MNEEEREDNSGGEKNNILDIGDVFPDFTLDSQLGPISYHALIEGKWGLIITFHKAFDPVTTTDLGMVCKLIEEYESRNIAVLTMGCDTVSNYRRWIKDIEELQEVKVNLPLISDPECLMLQQMGCAKISPITEELVTMSNSVFIIDIDKRVRSILKYSSLIGRNFYEIIRQYDALQMVTYHSVVCPANWSLGQDCFVNPDISDKQANNMLPKGFVAIKPWFRLTPAPDSK